MATYILSVCGAVILSSLILVLLPEGRLGKFINGILKLFCLLVMTVPLFQFFTDEEYAVDSGDVNSEIKLDDPFIEYFYEEMSLREEVGLKELLETEYLVELEVRIGWTFVDYAYEVSNVTIKIKNFGMYGDDEHILVISELRDRTAEVMKISAEAVEVYE